MPKEYGGNNDSFDALWRKYKHSVMPILGNASFLRFISKVRSLRPSQVVISYPGELLMTCCRNQLKNGSPLRNKVGTSIKDVKYKLSGHM